MDKSFSVAMAVYHKDNALFFERALSSITDEQTIIPNEIVLVCDGPLNNELDSVIEKYKSKYPIKVIRLPENKGLGNALRIAVDNSSNELIARMDSDDISAKDRFEQQLSFLLENPEVDIIGGDITEFIDNETNIVGKRHVPTTNNEIMKYMRKRCAMNHVSVMYRKKAVQNAGNYQDWHWNEDYYLWIRMQLNKSTFANTGTVLVNVRVGKEMYQRRGGIKYFQSEYNLQKYMLKKRMITISRFILNTFVRFIIQIIMPNKIRAFIFRKFAREKNV